MVSTIKRKTAARALSYTKCIELYKSGNIPYFHDNWLLFTHLQKRFVYCILSFCYLQQVHTIKLSFLFTRCLNLGQIIIMRLLFITRFQTKSGRISKLCVNENECLINISIIWFYEYDFIERVIIHLVFIMIHSHICQHLSQCNQLTNMWPKKYQRKSERLQ